MAEVDQGTWYKLKQKPTALFGLLYIILASVSSLLAYTFIPDATSNANRQVVEISLQKPGFVYTALKVPNNMVQENNILYQWFLGKNEAYNLIPLDSIFFLNDRVVVHTLLDETKSINYSEFKLASTISKEIEKAIRSKHIVQKTSWLGTDRFGRDILSRMILGVRISLMAGLLAVLVSLLMGVTLGALAGYFGGLVDAVIQYTISVVWSIPTLLLVFAIVLALGRGLIVIFLAVGLTMWVDVARLVRGLVISLSKEQFVQAARSIGQRSGIILFKHILPNTTGPVLVITSSNFATAILVEAGLSYLGFGVEPPAPSLGNMLNENYGYALSGNIYIALIPALAVVSLVLAFNLLGSGLRDVFDVRE